MRAEFHPEMEHLPSGPSIICELTGNFKEGPSRFAQVRHRIVGLAEIKEAGRALN